MTRRRGPLALAVLVTALALLAGCASIPTSGPVRTTTPTTGPGEDDFVRVLARPPAPGASPTEIVEGFLAASADFDDDHAVAREYLTSESAAEWDPQAGVTVYESTAGYEVATIDDAEVAVIALSPAGSITSEGAFVQPASRESLRRRYAMTQVDGEWRIASVPTGLLLSSADVRRGYRVVNEYFLDISGGVLVPDPIYVPTQRPDLAAYVVQRLLAGPTEWLAPAVGTAFPEGTRLAAADVPITGGVAGVDLTTDALFAEPSERRQLAAQLTFVLTQLDDVSAVRITVRGATYDVPGIQEVSRRADWAEFDPNAAPADSSTYLVDDDRLARVSAAGEVSPLRGYFGATRGLDLAAASFDGETIAGAYGSTVRVGRSGATSTDVTLEAGSVTGLSWDRLGGLWIASGSGAPLAYGRSSDPPRSIEVDGLGSRRVLGMRVAREGARIALVVSAADDPSTPEQLYVGRIVRTGSGPSVSGLRRVESSLSGVRAVAWADATTLLVVAEQVGGTVGAYRVGVDGFSVVSAGAVPNLTTIAACPGRPAVAGALGSGAGTLWVDPGNGWRTLAPGRSPFYAG